MRTSILVVDDFYEDPHRVREQVSRLDFPRPPAQRNYPGRNSAVRFLPEGLDEVVSALVRERVVGSKHNVHGHFRLSLAGEDAQRSYYVHVDGDAHWSGILYLTLPQHCRGGTEFYRHRETNSDQTLIRNEEARARGYRDCVAYASAVIERDGNDLSRWEHLMTIPMRFNRLILFRPWFWHTAGESFGTGIEDGRLVQLFFFSAAPGTPTM